VSNHYGSNLKVSGIDKHVVAVNQTPLM